MIAAHAETDAAVAPVCQLCIGQGIEVQVNDVIQRSHGCFNRVRKHRVILYGKIAQRKAGKIAHHKFARARFSDDNRVAVARFNFSAYAFNRRHVLCNFGAQV